MQRSFSHLTPFSLAAGLLGLAGGLVGCAGGTAPPPPPAASGPPFAGVSLTVACADPGFAAEVKNRANAWAARTGATVRVEPKPTADVPAADAAVIPPAEVGAAVVAGRLAPLPAALRANSHPLQWDRILGVYRDNLPGWGGTVYGLPVAGDGFVLVYRTDRVPSDPPATWESVAEVAALPPLPASADRLLGLFHQIAACYDRKALADIDRRKGGESATEQGNPLHIRTGTWQPRLDAPAFTAAARWLADTRSRRPAEPSDDQLAALTTGPAAVAVLTLAEVSRLPKDPATGAVDRRFGVAPLPGTRTYFDPAGNSRPADRQGNYVPYLGSAGKIGVVFAGSAHPDAAWDLLAELAGPAGSTALLTDPTAGVGPFRTEHLSEDRDDLWLGYRFDPERTKKFAQAVRRYVSQTTINPALPLRTPDQAELMAALAAEVRKAATGQTPPDAAMAAAQAAWLKHDAAHKPDELATWRRNAAGIP